LALSALAWGLVAGSAGFLGAFIAWFVGPPARLIAAAMAFASGILMSVAAFELLDEAFAQSGFVPAAIGFALGACLFGAGLFYLDSAGARHRKRSTFTVVPTRDAGGIVALTTVLDGIPEALIIGVSFYVGTGLGIATVIAVFLSNVPESLAASTRMKAAGYGPAHVFGVWTLVTVATGLASLAGLLLLGDLRPEGISIFQGVAGGACLVFIVDAMIPEAFAEDHNAAGLIAALGFLTGFALSHGLG
jgi:zinc transporter, ZIP family